MRFQFENLIRMMPSLPLTAFLFLAGSFQCFANDKHPVPDFGTSREITLAEFLRKVAAANLDYAAQRYSIPIAKAQIAAAKVSPNPAAVFSYTGDVSGEKQASIYSSGFIQTIEMGGKRGSRVAVAQKNYLTAAATVEDFFRTLRGTAAGAFIDAVADRMIVEQKRSSYEALDKLATTNQQVICSNHAGCKSSSRADQMTGLLSEKPPRKIIAPPLIRHFGISPRLRPGSQD